MAQAITKPAPVCTGLHICWFFYLWMNNMQNLVTKNTRGELVITSLQIADVFGKEHYNVLKAIRKYLKDVKENCNEISAVKIDAAVFIDKNGDNQPMFELSEQEALIVTGRFTGGKAIAHQRRIANQFIAMRDYLRNLEANRLKTTTDELLEARKKLSFCGIDETRMKSIIQERSNHKVSEITALMGELGIIRITDAVRHYKKICVTDMGKELGIVVVNNTPSYPEVMHEKIRDIAATKELLQQKIRSLQQNDWVGYDDDAAWSL